MVNRNEVKTALSVERNTLSFAEFEKLGPLMSERVIGKNASIYTEGDELSHLFYVKEGCVKLSKVSDDGKDLILHYFYPGDLFGEYHLSNKHSATFSADALKECKVGLIKLKELNGLLSRDGAFAVSFSQWLSQMQWFTQLKLRDILFYGKNGALASTLIRAANTYGIHQGDHIHISYKATNYELANLIGSTRETVNRMLAKFQKDKLIELNNGRITITDLKGLKAICHCEDCPLSICRL